MVDVAMGVSEIKQDYTSLITWRIEPRFDVYGYRWKAWESNMA